MQFTRQITLATGTLLVLGLDPAPVNAQSHEHNAASAQTPALFDGLGDHHYAVSTSVPAAQAFFDQGLRLYYAFNHEEAIRSFREAQRLDADCAMCWWGEALALGPNINLPMDSAPGAAAYRAAEHASRLREHANERERGLIDALVTRYIRVPSPDRARLDSAYARAMGELAAAYPDDREISVLYAESLMDLRPWDYWTADRQPQPGMAEALSRLQRVVEEEPNHPGACHFYIHAVEKEYPERAVPCAERLAGLMPGAGHIVHMPGHIYIRVGRYLDAVETNRHAVHADETYIQDRQPGFGMYTAGYYPHNYDFMAFAASMIGRSRDAVDAADRVASLIPAEMFGVPGMDFLQHWLMRPYQFRVRFARWDEILAAPAPRTDLLHATALWHYVRGRALAATGDLEGARREQAALRTVLNGGGLKGVRLEFNQSADLVRIADRILSGWIGLAAGETDEAVRSLQIAVGLEDKLLYGEPPEWSIPARHDLGEALLRGGRWPEAEAVFRQDLARFPENGWSLAGLARALEAQSRSDEAQEVRARFEKAWATADFSLGNRDR